MNGKLTEKEVKEGKKELEDSPEKLGEPIIVQDGEKVTEIEIIEEGDPKWFEIVDYNGEEVKHYPYTGALQSVKTGKIVGNQGGRKGFDGSAMVAIAHANKKEAILDALTEIGVERGWGPLPGVVLARLVKKAIQIGLDDEGRTGTDNRKLVFGLVDYLEKEAGTKSPTLHIEVQTEESKTRIRAILDL